MSVARLAVAAALLLSGSRSAPAQDYEPDPMHDVPAALRALVVQSPYRIPLSYRRATIEYRLRIEGDPYWYWPDTGEQRVSASGGVAVLTVCDDCGREAPPSREALRRARLPTPWLQADDPTLIAYARRARGPDARQRMRALVGLVRDRLDGPMSYEGYLGAREAFDARSGDCTEFALLLAALGRARDIPTRVVVGVAYGSRFVGARHAFGPHAWVQAWTGQRWESFDAALDGFDSTHIAMAIGDGAPERFSAATAAITRLRIDEMARLGPVEVISLPPR